MKKPQLPPVNNRLLNKAFLYQGKNNVYSIEVLPIDDGEIIKVTFEKVNSPRRQGIWLKTDKGLEIFGEIHPSIDIWQDNSPDEVLIKCHTDNGSLYLYNIWEKENLGIRGRRSLMATTGMIIEELPNGCGYRYHCNDVGFDKDFSDLVFRIERVKEL